MAAASPLLTFAWFWQLKEWRWDRLREHLLREGWLLTLFGGRMRIACLPVFLLLILPDWLPRLWTFPASLAFLAGLSLIQPLLRKQKMPVWTSKAMTVTGTALAMTAAGSLLVAFSDVPLPLLFLPYVQAAFLAIAWLLLWPVDRFLKRRILRQAAELRLRRGDLTVIGITGSVGKTTTKELLAHILQDRGVLATPAHVNSEVGVARWLLRALAKEPAPATPVIVEMGAYRTGEIAALCAVAQPSLGIVTHIGSQHLALFGSVEALMQAKGELLRALPPSGRAFLNGDSERTRALQALCACPVTVAGTGGRADLEAFDIEETPTGLRFRAEGIPFSIPLHGTHNVVNVLLAIGTAMHLGMKKEEIAQKLRSFSPPHHTFEVRQEAGLTLLDDTHNASAASFKAAIDWAVTQPFERRVLLTSGLIELGDEHERTHRELGALARPVFQDVLFLNRRSADLFAEGYGSPVRLFAKDVQPLAPGTLLVCVGRMPPSTIRRLLPPHT